MNLEQYYGLTRPAFPRAATKASLLKTPTLERAIKRLNFGLERGVISGVFAEPGCGKSTLLSLFAEGLDAANYNVLCTSLTTLSPFSFISHIRASTGLPGRRFKGETAAALMMHFRSLPKRTVILVDEGHLLPDDSMEDLRLLTADNLDRGTPFSLVLVGQPALRDRLTEPRHEALWQRMPVRLNLTPLNETELPRFLDTHMKAAGAKRKTIFEQGAVEAIFQHSRGIHRVVQNIALEAMLVAMDAGLKSVDTNAVQQAVVDMEAA